MRREVAQDLSAKASRAEESAGVLLASLVVPSNDEVRLLVRQLYWVPDSGYLRRHSSGLSICSEGYVPALGLASDLAAIPIWFHTHPGTDGVPLPSSSDETVDRQIGDVFRLRSGAEYYGSCVFSPRGPGFTFTGYLQGNGEARLPFRRVWIVGDRWQLVYSFDSQKRQLSPIFDRSVRALGSSVQEAVGDLSVAVVGCGGTGSAVAEQLVRLGVRRLQLIDPDVITESNVARVYGSRIADVGKPKVEVLANHLSGIAPGVSVRALRMMITVQSAAKSLVGCDLVFGCTDDNAGRLVLSRFASYFLTPVIDCGILLSSNEGVLTGIDGRVTTLTPGEACLVCRGRIDLARASSELLTPEERVRRVDEGYAPALGRTEPAVVTFTTWVAATAVSELVERLVGYGPDTRPSEILLRCHDREISTNRAMPLAQHYCHPDAGKLGIGTTDPFLEQTWHA